MVIMYGRLEYDIHHERAHDSATSEGPNNVASLQAPSDSAGGLFSVESNAVRMTFDGQDPSASRGVVFDVGTHFVPIGREFRFVSTGDGPATVSILWVRIKLGGAPSTE
jgi:hypothetical protein